MKYLAIVSPPTIYQKSRETLQATRSSFVRTLGHEELDHRSDDNVGRIGIIGGGNIKRNKRGGKRRSSISYDYDKEDDYDDNCYDDYDDDVDASQRRLFSYPRYATAAFRLLYCSASCAVSLRMFRNADFWPHWVGGKEFEGATRHCWDLSGGGLTIQMLAQGS